MKKSILITGRQGSGKTEKLIAIVSTHDASRVVVHHSHEFSHFTKMNFEAFEVVGVEEAISVQLIESVAEIATQCQTLFVVTTQLTVKELSEKVLSAFEIVNCTDRQLTGY